MTVLEGCQWAAVKAVNFTGTWRKCLCVHRVGSLLSLGVSLLLFKLAIHAHVAVFHNQVRSQQCLCFVCSWTLPSNSSSSFSSSPSLPWPWQVSLDGVGWAGRGKLCLYSELARQAPTPFQKVSDCTGSTQIGQIFLLFIQGYCAGLGASLAPVTWLLVCSHSSSVGSLGFPTTSHDKLIFFLASHEPNFSV